MFPTATQRELKIIDKLLSYESVIHKVQNSSRKMTEQNIQRFDNYCKEAYITQLKTFKFWPMNDSKHRLWSHSAIRMRQLGGYATGLISENALERSVREIFAYLSTYNIMHY